MSSRMVIEVTPVEAKKDDAAAEHDDSMPPPSDLMWAKLGRFDQYWPGQVVTKEIQEQVQQTHKMSSPSKGVSKLVRFFGSYDFAWVSEANLAPFDEKYQERVKAIKTKKGQRALEEAERYRQTGHLPLAFAAVLATNTVVPEPAAVKTPPSKTQSKRRSSGKIKGADDSAPKSAEKGSGKKGKIAKVGKGGKVSTPSRSAHEIETERRERRWRVLQHLALLPPMPLVK